MGKTKTMIYIYIDIDIDIEQRTTQKGRNRYNGLVYLEIGSIFTAIPVSLSQSLRQLLHREIIHAEFGELSGPER
jgi:hypothetical protein